MNSKIIDFYLGLKPDSEKRMLFEIHNWNFQKLEECHDYIQWLFPLSEPSSANSYAPILTRNDIKQFHNSDHLKKNLVTSFEVIMTFFGFDVIIKNKQIKLSKTRLFKKRAENWLTKYNHNFLRLTRIIKCLMMAGLDNYAYALFEKLSELYDQGYKDIIGERSFEFWKKALEKPGNH